MTNPNDPAFAFEGSMIAIQKDLDKIPELINKVAVIANRYQGLTKREYFAAMAMNGLLSDSETMVALLEILRGKDNGTMVAESALNFADALIAELNKEVKP